MIIYFIFLPNLCLFNYFSSILSQNDTLTILRIFENIEEVSVNKVPRWKFSATSSFLSNQSKRGGLSLLVLLVII